MVGSTLRLGHKNAEFIEATIFSHVECYEANAEVGSNVHFIKDCTGIMYSSRSLVSDLSTSPALTTLALQSSSEAKYRKNPASNSPDEEVFREPNLRRMLLLRSPSLPGSFEERRSTH